MSVQNTSPTTHVIFDYGGTVANEVVMLYEVFKEIAAKNGKTITDSFIKVLADADSYEDAVQKLLDITHMDSNRKMEILNEILEMLDIRIETKGVPMNSGVHKLIQHLYDNNIPMAIATNGAEDEINHILDNTIGYNPKHFSHIVKGADDPEVKNNKPAPDIYLVCAKRFKTPPKSLDSCVIFEDSIRGITGAVNTGMKSVFLNQLKRPKEEFESIVDKITVIIDSFDNFKPESVGLPPYPS